MENQIAESDILLEERSIMAKVMSLSQPWYVKEIFFDKHLKIIIVRLDFRKGATFHCWHDSFCANS